MQSDNSATQIALEDRLLETSYECDQTCLEFAMVFVEAANLPSNERLAKFIYVQRALSRLIADVTGIVMAENGDVRGLR